MKMPYFNKDILAAVIKNGDLIRFTDSISADDIMESIRFIMKYSAENKCFDKIAEIQFDEVSTDTIIRVFRDIVLSPEYGRFIGKSDLKFDMKLTMCNTESQLKLVKGGEFNVDR